MNTWICSLLSYRRIKIRCYLSFSVVFDFASHQMHPVRRWATGDGSLTNTDVTGRHFLIAIDRSFQQIRRQQKSKWLIKEVTMFAEALIYSQNVFKIKYATKLTKLTTQLYKQGKKRGKRAQNVTAVWQRSWKEDHAFVYPAISKWRIFRIKFRFTKFKDSNGMKKVRDTWFLWTETKHVFINCCFLFWWVCVNVCRVVILSLEQGLVAGRPLDVIVSLLTLFLLCLV